MACGSIWIVLVSRPARFNNALTLKAPGIDQGVNWKLTGNPRIQPTRQWAAQLLIDAGQSNDADILFGLENVAGTAPLRRLHGEWVSVHQWDHQSEWIALCLRNILHR